MGEQAIQYNKDENFFKHLHPRGDVFYSLYNHMISNSEDGGRRRSFGRRVQTENGLNFYLHKQFNTIQYNSIRINTIQLPSQAIRYNRDENFFQRLHLCGHVLYPLLKRLGQSMGQVIYVWAKKSMYGPKHLCMGQSMGQGIHSITLSVVTFSTLGRDEHCPSLRHPFDNTFILWDSQ